MNLKRFSEEFIQMTGCVVRGLVKIHTHSYYCPNLRGDHIAVVKDNGLISACLWDFVFCETGNNGRSKDWRRLGLLLEKTARNHGAYTIEIKDMCDRMKNLTLTGMDVLKHSAMLSVRDKFDSVLALNTFVFLHCKSQDDTPTDPCTISSNSIPSQADFSTAECTISSSSIPSQADFSTAKCTISSNSIPSQADCPTSQCTISDREKSITLLKDRLNTNVVWISQLPTWIRKRILELGFDLPKKDTFRGFIWNLRCLIEHENKYIPPEANVKVSSWEMQFSDIDPDLEFEIREAWAELLLEALNYSMQIGLEF
uniref:Uncharacterized protein n=1 Tax=Oryza punctata TaxID=4537 RepID=A0A0E0MFT6_ORYPU